MRKKTICAILLACYLVLILPLIKPVFAAADLLPQRWEVLNPKCQTDGVATIQGFECVFQNLVRIILPLLVITLFVMLVAGSLAWLTSGGDQKKLQKAKATMTYAIIGIVAFFGIYLVFQLIKSITGINLSVFEIPGP